MHLVWWWKPIASLMPNEGQLHTSMGYCWTCSITLFSLKCIWYYLILLDKTLQTVKHRLVALQTLTKQKRATVFQFNSLENSCGSWWLDGLDKTVSVIMVWFMNLSILQKNKVKVSFSNRSWANMLTVQDNQLNKVILRDNM